MRLKYLFNAGSFYTILLLVCITAASCIHAQGFTTNELLKYPYSSGDELDLVLEKKGWQKHNFEIVSDSNFIRRTWRLGEKTDRGVSYLTFYEFTKDTAENYFIYQFSNRKELDKYRSDLKSVGYKILKQKKKKKEDDESYLNSKNEECYYNEKAKGLVVIKEEYLFGLNCFVINFYKPRSEIVRHFVESKKK